MEHNEEPAESSVSVSERVECLELVMRHRCGDDGIDLARVIRSHPVDEVAHTGFQCISGGRGYEACGVHGEAERVCLRPAANHDLAVPHPSGYLMEWCASHEDALKFAEQRERQRLSDRDSREAEVCHAYVVEDFYELRGGRVVLIRGEDFGQGRIRSFEG